MSQTINFDEIFDVVVVGSGAAGLTTALTAAKKGNLKVLLCEKAECFGGTTAYSGGGIWIPSNQRMKEFGFEDTREASETYMNHFLRGSGNRSLISAFLDSGPEMCKWVSDNSELGFIPSGLPDYHMDAPGAKVGRSMIARPFDGRKLGSELLRQIRLPLPGTRAFGSLQVDATNLGRLTDPFGSVGNASFMVKMMLKYGWDLIRYGKGSELCNGNAIVGALIKSLQNATNQVTLWNSSPALSPIVHDGKVQGLTILRNGRHTSVGARKGVVLAAGGFSRSREFATHFLPTSEWSASAETNTGDGLRIGLTSGGALARPLEDAAIWSFISQYRVKDRVYNFPHLGLDRTKPGCLIVDSDGNRFANESEAYQPFGQHFNKHKVLKAYFVCDHRFIRRYGVGVILPWPYPFAHYVRRGYVVRGRNIRELATRIDIDPVALSKTVDKFNGYAREGRDHDFHRGEGSFDVAFGDPRNRPNQSLRPCERAPFYAVPMFAGNIGTVYGFETNEDSQILSSSGTVVPGLYAVGSDQNTVMRGTYPGAGSTIGPGMTFGYRAGVHLARGSPRQALH